MPTNIPPRLSHDEIQSALTSLNGWSYEEERNCLIKEFTFKGFYKTMGFVNAVAFIANKEIHHPDLEVSYNKCVVRYQTHDAGGITVNDIKCAKAIEALEA